MVRFLSRRAIGLVSALPAVARGAARHQRVDLGIGEGATRLELGGFGIPARNKRTWSLEAAEQIANMMVMEPYPGFQGESFSMPARNVLPKPLQKPHPPMWMACTNRDTIKVAASRGLGALAFSFLDPEEAKKWAEIYYGIIKSDECVPLGHRVNANIAMVSAFSLHPDRAEAVRRGQEGFEFFGYAINALVAQDTRPGRSRLWEEFQERRKVGRLELGRDLNAAPGIGTPDEFRQHIREYEKVGVDQIIFLQRAGRNSNAHICESLQRFAAEVLPEFAAKREDREKRKQEELAPFIEAALKRKQRLRPLADHEIPVVEASVKKAKVG
jgi:alkanesulfonate monooxygenase SsuD/methylene tetrahydromethanopterin reductase-like flavin-dependent oxidoreductase (luciferase family)